MAPWVLISVLLLLALFLGPFGVYAYALARLERPLPAFLAGTALLLALVAAALLSAQIAP
jgi:hypothetical protein